MTAPLTDSELAAIEKAARDDYAAEANGFLVTRRIVTPRWLLALVAELRERRNAG